MPPKKKSQFTFQNLIRVHPVDGGMEVRSGNNLFQNVSCDAFFALDITDKRNVFYITRKFNFTVGVNPALYTAGAFFRYLTVGENEEDPFESGALKATEKCSIHGDGEESDPLYAHRHLKGLLEHEGIWQEFGKGRSGIVVNGVKYAYHSVGVAANEGFASVDCRKGNPFDNATSHLEIKFKRISESIPNEYLCINIHLSPKHNPSFTLNKVIERIRDGVALFYQELGLSGGDTKTLLSTTFEVTLDNFAAKGFSCRHGVSLRALEDYKDAQKHITDSEKRTPSTLLQFMPSAWGSGASSSCASAPKDETAQAPPLQRPKLQSVWGSSSMSGAQIVAQKPVPQQPVRAQARRDATQPLKNENLLEKNEVNFPRLSK